MSEMGGASRTDWRFGSRTDRQKIFKYIEVFYKSVRRHERLNYLLPLNVEQQFYETKLAATRHQRLQSSYEFIFAKQRCIQTYSACGAHQWRVFVVASQNAPRYWLAVIPPSR